ncbi:type II secretion system minor pseudopilin GspH [Natronospira bacteriovora]|uniref:Type II secretion system protein H n=1 Tax=Natronospira bacteriovora TaxID=3069753 RepID=A0ABU0W705_9GAMM|nr:type II secretion system minor pseudopilin GspH [Natronospira sp. AB-CW4]MDQ2069250.1 type II secretion system minor pseudopilin GspH [Natronospira sp. AB-CW4]
MVSPTRPARQAVSGFTLIEIMVVMVIIGVIITIATLSTDRLGQQDEAAESRERLHALIRLAADRAMIEGGEYGLRLDREGYHFLQYREEGWISPEGREYRQRQWPDSIRVTLEIEGQPSELRGPEQEQALPQVLMTGTGEMTPFRVFLRHRDDTFALVLEGQGNGRLLRWNEEDGRPDDHDMSRRNRR